MTFRLLSVLSLLVAAALGSAIADEPPLKLQKGDHVVLVGNTLAERMQYFGHWETILHSRFPKEELVVRNLGWSADELTLRPRSKDFQDHGYKLEVVDSGVSVQEPPHEHAEPSDALFKAARLLTTKANDMKGLRL